MELQNHTIDRQLLEFSFPTRQQALQHQQEISGIYHQKLLPVIEQIFSRHSQGADHIRIEQLEVDLGTIAPAKLEETLIARLQQLLPDALMKKLREPNRGFNITSAMRVATRRDNEQQVTKTISDQQSDLDLFIYYVECGRMPWWVPKKANRNLEQLVARLAHEQPASMDRALQALVPYGDCARRIIYQLDDTVLKTLLVVLQPTMAELIYRLNRDLYAIHQHRQLLPVGDSEFRVTIWQHAFQYCVSSQTEGSASLLTPAGTAVKGQKFSSNIYRYIQSVVNKMAIAANPEYNGTDIALQIMESIRILSGRKFSFQTISFKTIMKTIVGERTVSARATTVPLTSTTTTVIHTPDGNLTPVNNLQKKKPAVRSVEDERIQISNAGLVLLWPFLPAFFEGIGLTENKTFVTEDAARRGALLLQYMATRETATPEHELTLNKLLSGLDVDEPLPLTIDPTTSEKEEAEHLLNTVALRWEALKGTSGESLRRTFIIKDGILSAQTNGWKLQIEKSAVDMLVNKLPWSISIVRLPWTKQILFVEW